MPLLTRFTERLMVKFNDEEKLQKGSELAELFSDVSELKDDLKSVKKGLDAQIAEKEARINKISEELRSGQEFRLIECEWEYNWDDGLKDLRRLDTLDIIKQLDISDAERQTKLELDVPETTDGQGVAEQDAALSENDAAASVAAEQDANYHGE